MRLLIATEFPPNAHGGGPAVVRQVLKGFPAEKLCWWSCFPDTHDLYGQRTAEHCAATIPSRFYPDRRFRGIKSAILEGIWAPIAKRRFQKLLKEFKPDAVWIIAHDWSIPQLHSALLETDIPFHVSIQDYADVDKNIERMGQTRALRFARQTEELYTMARTRDAVCQPMADDLRKRTKKSASLLIRYGLEESDFTDIETQDNGLPSESIRIAYPGTILVEKSVQIFAQAFEQIRHDCTRSVTLEFFGAHSYRNRTWFNSTWMREHGSLSAKALHKELNQCDWGLAVMALDDENPRYNQYSFPTKFITCLSAGLPAISLGHKSTSLMQMTADYPVGVAITDNNTEAIATELAGAFAIEQPRQQFRTEIMRCAREQFDAKVMRTHLMALLDTH